MIRYFVLLAVFACPSFAALNCSPFTGGGIHLRCSISYDATVPSGQTYARTIAGIWNPTGSDGVKTACTVLMLEGKGWNESSANFAGDVETAADNLVLTHGCAVYSVYYSWPVGQQVAATHSTGDTSLIIEGILANNSTVWYPGCTSAAGVCAGIATPFTAVYGTYGGDAETITITSQGGTLNTTWTVNALANNHSANEPLYIPKTEWPAPLADLVSFLNWAGANMGQGTYPGDPMHITVLATSSSGHLTAMVPQVSSSFCLATGCGTSSWWGSTVGFNGGSSNSAAPFAFTSMFLASPVLDTNWIYTNGTAGTPANTLAQSAVTALLGCIPGTDTGCTALATAASPITLTKAQFPGAVVTTSGTFDATTPVCAPPLTWASNAPCAPNMYSVFAHPYFVFANPPYISTSIGHASDCFTNVSVIQNGCWANFLTFMFGGAPGVNSQGP